MAEEDRDPVRDRDRSQVGAGLLAVGLVLVACPLYLGALLPYPTPGDSFRLTPVYHAQLSVLGLLAVWTGAYALARRRPMSARLAAGGAFGGWSRSSRSTGSPRGSRSPSSGGTPIGPSGAPSSSRSPTPAGRGCSSSSWPRASSCWG